MSTRSVITVFDADSNDNSYSIYRHCDGYPDSASGVLETLAKALPFAWALPRFEAEDFAAAIIRAWKQPGGGNIYLTPGKQAHGDIEWYYEIRPAGKQIAVTVFEVTNDWGGDKPPVYTQVGKPHLIG
jgi:hypothetical protein